MKVFLQFFQLEKAKFGNSQLLFWRLRASPRKVMRLLRLYRNWEKKQLLGNVHSTVDSAIFDCSVLPFEDFTNSVQRQAPKAKENLQHPLWFYAATIEDFKI